MVFYWNGRTGWRINQGFNWFSQGTVAPSIGGTQDQNRSVGIIRGEMEGSTMIDTSIGLT